MKKTTCLIVAFVFFVGLCLFSSCTVNKKTNYIFEGSFVCEKDGVVYYLEIKEINEKSYSERDGFNVVHDVVNNNKYYELSFYWMIESQKETYNFINLKDSHPKTNGLPVFYVDDNNNKFIPQNIKAPNKYTVVLNGVYLELEDYKS